MLRINLLKFLYKLFRNKKLLDLYIRMLNHSIYKDLLKAYKEVHHG